MVDVYESHLIAHASNKAAKESAMSDATVYKNKMNSKVVGLYECLYCNFGCCSRREFPQLSSSHKFLIKFLFTVELRVHLQEHPRETVYVCKRQSPENSADFHSIESTEIFKLPKRSDVQIVAFDLDKFELRNSANVAKIRD